MSEIRTGRVVWKRPVSAAEADDASVMIVYWPEHHEQPEAWLVEVDGLDGVRLDPEETDLLAYLLRLALAEVQANHASPETPEEHERMRRMRGEDVTKGGDA